MKKQFGRSASGDKPFRKKSATGSGKPDFSKKKFSDKKTSGDKPPYAKKGPSDRPPFKKSYGEDRPSYKKNFGDDKEGGDKPFKKSFGGDRERSTGDKPFKKSFGGDRERSTGDKPIKKSFDGDRERSTGDKPFKKSFGGDRERSSSDKPFKKSFGDKPDYAKKRSESKSTYSKKGPAPKSFRKRVDTETGFTGRKFADRDEKPGKDAETENWQVFENADDAKEFIKSNRDDKKAGKGSNNSEKEYKNDNRPLRVAGGDENSVRLNRFIANTGICSRREADDLIEAGVVKINGKIVTELGIKVGPGDTVHYGDQLLRREKMSYVLLNKPKDYITTTDDPQERKTVMSLVETAGDVRIYPVGRLDRNTTGLLLFTNDGDLAERLTHPKNGVRKIYHVSLDKNLRTDDFEKILSGYEMEDGYMKADELSFVGDGMDKKEVGIVIHSGRNRIVRRLFEGLGYDVIRLDRVVYAGLTKKNLPRGKFRHLTTEEVGMLRMQIGGEKKTNFKKTDTKHTKGKRKGKGKE
ncbi:pseudouridine synthase [soil metagenome]